MNTEELIEGLILLTRERVSGWSTGDSGEAAVYPEYPPLDLDSSKYPRATVEQTGYTPVAQDVEQKLYIGDALMKITVFGVNTQDCVKLAGDVHDAVTSHHDSDDSSGSPYFTSSWLESDGNIGELLTLESEQGDLRGQTGATRKQKSVNFTFRTITIK